MLYKEEKMILNQITLKHLNQLIRENVGKPEIFTKKIIPRLKNENPVFPQFLDNLNKFIEGDFRSRGIVFTTDHRNLVLYIGVVSFRVLELAQLSGKQKEDASVLNTILMGDPDNESMASNVIDARDETSLLLTKLGVGNNKNNI